MDRCSPPTALGPGSDSAGEGMRSETTRRKFETGWTMSGGMRLSTTTTNSLRHRHSLSALGRARVLLECLTKVRRGTGDAKAS